MVTLPTVQPTGPSFEILHGPMSVVYAAPKAESSTRPTKRARKSRREGGRTFFGFEAETGIMDVGIEKGAMGRGIMTINSVSEDFRDGVVAVCKHGYRLAFAAGENEARVLLPGTAVWLDEVAWDAGRNAWIVHNFLNLSEMRALLHSPFCREAVSVASLPSIEKRRGYCTVQASVRVLAVTGIDDLHAFLKVEDVPMPGKKMPPASNGESTAVTLLAPESVVRSVFDLSIRSLNELANHEDEGRTLLPETLLTSIVITKDRLDGFRFIIAAAAPAPVDW